MVMPDLFIDFIDYLNDIKGDWEKTGLRPDAPESAKIAFEEYLKLENESGISDEHIL